METKEKADRLAPGSAWDSSFDNRDFNTDRIIWLARNNAHARHEHHVQRAQWFRQGAWCWVIGALRLIARWVR